jgi:hypothetical protein
VRPGKPAAPGVAGVVAILLAVASLAPACQARDGFDLSPRIPDDASPVAFEPLGRSLGSLHGPEESARLVIRGVGAWTDLWRARIRGVDLPSSPPAVDFDVEMVVVAATGERPTGGYSVSVEGVYESGGRIYVDVLETAPDPDCMLIQMVTSPVDVVRVFRTAADVVFVERREVRGC